MKITYCLLASIFALLAYSGMEQPGRAAELGGACVHRLAPAGAIGKRVAIIVGNGAYANDIPALTNPTNDADATAKAVAGLGFEIYLSTNADSKTLQKCLDQAYAGLTGADVAMFYYSGHGIQIRDENYLVATDAGSKDLQHGFVPVQPIVDALQKGAKATLVLLDACRNNPMVADGQAQAGLSVSTGRGLARVKDPAASGKPDGVVAGMPAAVQTRGLMVAYATSPNAVAQDGTGRLSPFTGAFVKAVGTSGYSIQRVMGDVTRMVGEETDWAQTPWMKSSLSEELKLGGGETLDEARSISDNHAARSKALLDNRGKTHEAIVEALKGLPATPDEAALKRFPKAYLALYSAVQSREVTLPLSPGHSLVAVSTQDRVAVFKQNADVNSGAFELWSISEKKVVATPGVAKGVWKFAFSSHGKYLAVQSTSGVSVLDGHDGTKLFDLRQGGSLDSMDFSPDESRMLLVASNGLVIIDMATRKPTTVVRSRQLDVGTGKRRDARMAQAMFGGNDAVCFILSLDNPGNGAAGVFDLKANKTSHVRDVTSMVSVLMCDPTGKYMVRSFAVNNEQQGMEIWDLAADKVSLVSGPIVNILGVDPKGDYVSVLAFADTADGLYDLAAAKKGHPATVPDGFSISGSKVYDAAGSLVNQDLDTNAWRDWPDESLYGPALVAKAMASLTDAQRAAVAKERINFAVVAGGR